jgi:hypothetical protein
MIIRTPSVKHICVDISAHGFGHLAQTAAVLNELDADNTRLTIRSMAPLGTLQERIRLPFQLLPYQQDNGMIMYDALRVDADRTMDWYRDFHSDYDTKISNAARQLESLSPDLVFADIPYLSLDAASLVGIPSIAMCSLNWADIFQCYCGHLTGAREIHSEIINAYSQAEIFLQPTPSMPMTDLKKIRPISPIAFLGTSQSLLQVMLELSPTGKVDATFRRFVLIGVGGLSIDNFPLETWPRLERTCWIFPDSILSQYQGPRRLDFAAQSQFAALQYIDLLTSVDCIVTKTGYGTQTEAVVNQVPTICINRHDWPEHKYLKTWHEQHGQVAFVDWTDVGTSTFGDLVWRMMERKSQWILDRVVPTGAEEAASVIQQRLAN